jgi:hypothetical protein
MGFQEAKDIRNKSFSNRMASKLVGGEKVTSALGNTIREGTKAKMMGIKEKFHPMNIARAMTGNLGAAIVGKMTGASQENMEYFTGKSKSGGEGDTASKLSKMESDNSSLDLLMKIYTLMSESHKTEILAKEEENNKAEGRELQKKRRHEELIAAIKGATGNVPTATIVKEKEDSGGIFGGLIDFIKKTIGDAIGWILEMKDFLKTLFNVKGLFSILSSLGGLVASPLGVGLIAAVVAGTVGAWMVKQIAADPQAALEGKGGIGMAVAGLGSEGQLPSADEEQKDKTQKKSAEQVDKKGLSGASLKELEDKRDLLISYGDPRARVKKGSGDDADKAKAKQLDDIETEINNRKSSKASAQPAAKTAQSVPETPQATAAPAPSKPATAQLNEKTIENLDSKLPVPKDTKTAQEINNTNINTKNESNVAKTNMPSIRNMEETFQRMIMYSTRVV